ncbi:MAG: hypothetical protein ACR2IE_17410 [Candidatus Sumerlaeaceae bacterium]
MRLLHFLLIMAIATSCFLATAAQPPRFNFQAKLTDNLGAPLTGSHACIFRLYEGGTAAGAGSGTLRYEETATKTLTSGVLSHVVGTGTPVGAVLSRSVFATDADFYLQFSVDGNVNLPRSRIEPVPFAIVAGEATTASVALEALHAANGDLRTVISPAAPAFTTPYVISQPGSYYLAGNITVASGNAINILTSGVTLDMNGFTISSTANPAAGVGIQITGSIANISIRNGNIRGQVTFTGPTGTAVTGAGFVDGISETAGPPTSVEVSRVKVEGCAGNGIALSTPASNVVENCSVRMAGQVGISAGTARSCIAVECGNVAIYALVVNDSMGAGRMGTGVYATTGASNSVGNSVAATGLYTDGTATSCKGQSETGQGLNAFSGATNCTGISVSAAGLLSNYLAVGCLGRSGSGIGVVAPITKGTFGFSDTGTGIFATTLADNCEGYTLSGGAGNYGIYATRLANMCTATNGAGGGSIALETGIAIGCTSGAGSIVAPQKFLGTP